MTPYDPGYEAARVLFNTRVRTRPALIAQCADTADVAAAIGFARDAGLLLGLGYELSQVRAFDSFPMTQHFETIGLFVMAGD